MARLIGSPILVGFALANQAEVFIALLIFLLLTDWFDGKLAVLWKQQTTFGARLDSVADLAMYSSLVFGAMWLRPDVLRDELLWLFAAVASYALNAAVSLVKFRRIPSYHTRSAKTCWLLTGVAAVSLFAGWVWPLRLTALAVVLANLEAIAITLVLSQWRADVPSIYCAWQSSNKKHP